MATVPVTVPVPSVPVSTPVAAKPNGFIRFIDTIKADFKKFEPIAEEVAVAAEPLLALSPIGPEYNLVVNAIVGARKAADASLSVGANLNGTQQMSLVLAAITPGVTAVLASKGITESATVTAAIAQFVQNVYGLQTGPAYIPSK